tara:strand:- start:126 stop:416 length:291 start_codon:yes stop_codon:yes gene_type:complete
LQTIVDNHREELGDTQWIVVNMAGTEDGIPDLSAENQMPILQDNVTAKTLQCYGASKWYIYVIDSSGTPRTIFYSLDLDAEQDRLLTAIEDARGGK